MHSLLKVGAGLAATGAGAFAYAAGYEVRAFRLRDVAMPCLPTGSEPIRLLHLSDIHLTPRQGRKAEWLRSLAALEPDVIVNTGDNISGGASIPVLMDSLGALSDVPGVFVFGSNDYWGPVAKNPLRYFLPSGGQKKIHGPPLPWRDLRAEFLRSGWLDLSNTYGELKVRGARIAFVGVDDPHLRYDLLDAVAGPADAAADVRLGVTHAPYLRVLDQFVGDGYDAVFAGHTHGGQLRVPGYGALVTNCDLDARRSRGLSTHEARGRRAWLHVSAGLGTSPYAPYRFACHPEATLVTLLPAPVSERTSSADSASRNTI
jgi:predicted MPP superfamily phosphohydrolase